MANRREIVKRRKAVGNIRKITRTMQLIATARYQVAHQRAVASRPYSEKLAEMVADLARSGAGGEHPLLRSPEAETRSALVVITSSRGLAGSYNMRVLRRALEHLEDRRRHEVATDVYMVRRKGIAYFRFLGEAMREEIVDVADMPRFEQVEPLADRLMGRFLTGDVQSVWVTSTRFLSAGQQRAETRRLLPLAWEAEEEGARAGAVEYEFSPDPRRLLDALLPATVRVRLYQAFTEAAVSEQIARMVAMKSATKAAEDKIKQLTREYNRARQTAITMELLDIVGGANALA